MCFMVVLGVLGNYLRVRGEYCVLMFTIPCLSELPPRARRIRLGVGCAPKPHGTTSACAENTSPASTLPAKKRNYLRVRGEYQAHISRLI